MSRELHETDLEGYLDEALPAAEMAAVEDALRNDPQLVRRLSALLARRDQGLHSVGAIWRRQRLSCPDRELLGTYLLGAAGQEEAAYIAFHLDAVGCRYCHANLADLKRRQTESQRDVVKRRKRYFESSAGSLRSR